MGSWQEINVNKVIKMKRTRLNKLSNFAYIILLLVAIIYSIKNKEWFWGTIMVISLTLVFSIISSIINNLEDD